jgi:hypothetical protein
MSYLSNLVNLYDNLKAPIVSINPKKLAFVELFKGTGSMSSYTTIFKDIKEVVTLDKEAAFEPTFVMDILDANPGSPFIDKMNDLVRQGYFIIMHASPPCNTFSKMNTNGQKDDETIAAAVKLVEKAVSIMRQYSVLWCLENPATGSLWIQDFSIANFALTHDVDYCVYGGELKKSTRFVFSNTVVHELFTPRTCPGTASCAGGMINPETNRFVHLSWDKVSYQNRIALPKQLCINLLQALVEASKTIIPDFKELLSSRSVASPSRPSATRIESSTKRRKVALDEWNIEKGDVVLFTSTDRFVKTTSQNISICEDDVLMNGLFIRAFNVEDFDVSFIDGEVVFVFKGKPYCGTFANMILSNSCTVIAVPQKRMLRTMCVGDKEKYTFKITENKKCKIIDDVMELFV